MTVVFSYCDLPALSLIRGDEAGIAGELGVLGDLREESLVSLSLVDGLRCAASVDGVSVLFVVFAAGVLELFVFSVEAEETACPMEVSFDGTDVAPLGMEFSYSELSLSIAERIEEFIVMPRFSAKVFLSFDISGIQ